MLKIFRTNQLLLSVLLLAYAAFLRMAYFQRPLLEVPQEPGLGNYWVSPFIQEPSIFCFFLAIGLLFIQALTVNKIFFEHRLYRDLSLYAGVFLVLAGSILPEFLTYSSFLPANVLLLFALREVLKVYRTVSAADIIFNAGFFIGLASLFQPVYLVFLIITGIVIVNLKSGKFRDQFTLWAGAITPLFLIGTVYFFNDQFSLFWKQQWTGAFSLPQAFDWHHMPISAFLMMLFLMLFVVVRYPAILSKTKMEIQTKINTIYWFLAGGSLSILLSPSWHNYRWQAVVPVLGLLLGIHFTKIKPVIAEIWHIVLIVLLFFFHFSTYFDVFNLQ